MTEEKDTGLEPYKIGNIKTSELSIAPREIDPLLAQTGEDSLSVVEQIRKMSLINPKDAADLKDAKSFLISTYTDVPQYRPMVVKVASVLDDGRLGTPDAKFWQCKKEAEVHFQELVSGVYKWQLAQVDLEEMDYKIASLESLLNNPSGIRDDLDPQLINFDLRRMKIKRERYEFNVKQLEKNIKYRIEEVTDWAVIAKSLEPDCKHSTTNAQEHNVEAFYRRLEFEIANAKDEKTKQQFESQLNTLKRLMVQKAQQRMKTEKEKGGN